MAAVCLVFAFGARAGDIFDLGRRRAREVVVTVGPALADVDVNGAAPMALRLHGVIGVWRGRELGDLLSASPREARPIGDPPNAESLCVLHLSDGAQVRKRVEVVRTEDGTIVGRELDAGENGEIDVVELDRVKMAALLRGLDQYRGGFDAADVTDPVGEVFLFTGTKMPGWFTFDAPTIEERVASPSIRVEASLRFLYEAAFQVRLPSGYDPRRPAGLVVWISPTEEGRIPESFFAALDELYLIAIGPDECGNDRIPGDRFQLVFDAMATATRAYHVDARRVYVTGFSGGGRMASMIHGAFADVVSGSVPIGGANAYKHVPMGTGKYWPAGYRRPDGEIFSQFRRQRMACVTGDNDFNYENVQGVVGVLRGDRVDAKVWDVEGLAHELPPAGEFLGAMRWVDEPYQQMRDDEVAEARDQMETYRTRFGDGPVENEGQRRVLMQVMERGAWSDAAWEAVGVMAGQGH
jgi:hypothetical protein